MQIRSLQSFTRFLFCGIFLFTGYTLAAQDSAMNAQRLQQSAKGYTITGLIKDASTKKRTSCYQRYHHRVFRNAY